MKEFKVGDVIKDRSTGLVQRIYALGDYGILYTTHCTPEQKIGWVYETNAELHNPPLTAQDLAKMDGHRVWVEFIENGESICVERLTAMEIPFSLLNIPQIKISRHKPERIDTMNNEPKVAPNYEAMYHNLLEEFHPQIQKLECENEKLKQDNATLRDQLTKSQSDQATLFSKVEIYEFCVRAFTGMGEKRHE